MALSQFELSKITLKNLNKFDLSPTAKLVLLALVDCYNPQKAEIYPKQKTIADQLGVNISSVKRAIKELTTARSSFTKQKQPTGTNSPQNFLS